MHYKKKRRLNEKGPENMIGRIEEGKREMEVKGKTKAFRRGASNHEKAQKALAWKNNPIVGTKDMG